MNNSYKLKFDFSKIFKIVGPLEPMQILIKHLQLANKLYKKYFVKLEILVLILSLVIAP